jgi:hypothetical protein
MHLFTISFCVGYKNNHGYIFSIYFEVTVTYAVGRSLYLY